MLRSGEAKYSFVEEKEKGEETDKGTDGERPRLAATQVCLNVRPDGDMVKNVSLYSFALRPANLRLCVYTGVSHLNARVHMVLRVIHVLLFG